MDLHAALSPESHSLYKSFRIGNAQLGNAIDNQLTSKAKSAKV
jgi:hypothetical protein